MRRLHFSFEISIACLVATHLFIGVCVAAEPLRWSLSAGEQLDYELAHTVKVSLGGSDIDYGLQQKMDLSWHVDEVAPDGTAVVRQSISRIVLVLDHLQQELTYDSAADDEPRGLAALAGSLFVTLRETPLEFQLSPRGVITNMKVPPEILETMTQSTLADSLQNLASEAGLRQLFFTAVPELPQEPLENGDQWDTSQESTNPLFGRQRMHMNYLFEGVQQREGKELAAIRVRPEVTFPDAAITTSNVPQLESSGEVLFDAARGRLFSSHWTVQLKLAHSDGQQAAESTLKQDFSLQLAGDSPAVESSKRNRSD